MPEEPKTLTPEAMRAQAAALEKEAKAMTARALQLRQVAAAVEALSEESRLPLDRDDATIWQPMQSEKTHSNEKRRPGRKFAGGPFSVASNNSGKSMTQIAEALGEPLGTVKAWNALHRNPPDHIREKLAKKPYSVPSSAWKA